MDCSFSSVVTLIPQKDTTKTQYVNFQIDDDHELGQTFYEKFRGNDLVLVVQCYSNKADVELLAGRMGAATETWKTQGVKYFLGILQGNHKV